MVQDEGPTAVPEITCREVVQWASAYLDKHVGDDRKRQIVLHLAICAGCKTYLKQIVTIRDTVGSLPKAADRPLDIHRLKQAFLARRHRTSSGN